MFISLLFFKITFSEVGILSKLTNIWLLKHLKIYENEERNEVGCAEKGM